MGSGSGTTGYGQSIASSQVGQSDKISVAQWNNLRNDIIRCRQHQTGSNLGSKAPEDAGYLAGFDLPIPTTSKQVKESWRAAYMAMATDCDTNRLTAPPPSGEATRADLVTQQIRTTAWNGRISQTIVVTFPSADEGRYFFNTGGQIEFSADRSGGTAGLKNVTWSTILSNMGTIKFNYDVTSCTGTGYTSTIGWYDLTTSDNLIFEKDAPSGAYAPNKYFIYARVNSTTDRRIGYFTIWFADDSGQPPSYPDPGFGIDENVDGVLTSTVQVYRASGTNVTRPVPPASTTTIA